MSCVVSSKTYTSNMEKPGYLILDDDIDYKSIEYRLYNQFNTIFSSPNNNNIKYSNDVANLITAFQSQKGEKIKTTVYDSLKKNFYNEEMYFYTKDKTATIPYRKIDDHYYCSLFINIIHQGGGETGAGLSVMWSTTKDDPTDDSFQFVSDVTRFCNSYEQSTNTIFGYLNDNAWCCDGKGADSTPV